MGGNAQDYIDIANFVSIFQKIDVKNTGFEKQHENNTKIVVLFIALHSLITTQITKTSIEFTAGLSPRHFEWSSRFVPQKSTFPEIKM